MKWGQCQAEGGGCSSCTDREEPGVAEGEPSVLSDGLQNAAGWDDACPGGGGGGGGPGGCP